MQVFVRSIAVTVMSLLATTNAFADNGVPLKDYLNNVRSQLVEIRSENHVYKMKVDKLTLELQTSVTLAANGGIEIQVVNLGGDVENKNLQRLVVELSLPEGNEMVETTPPGLQPSMQALVDRNVFAVSADVPKSAIVKSLESMGVRSIEVPKGYTLGSISDGGTLWDKLVSPVPIRNMEGAIVGYVASPDWIADKKVRELDGVFITDRPIPYSPPRKQ